MPRGDPEPEPCEVTPFRPTADQVAAFCAQWPGALASGIPAGERGMPVQWALNLLAHWSEIGKQFRSDRNWQEAMMSRCRAAWSARDPRVMVGLKDPAASESPAAKGGASAPARKGTMWELTQKLKLVEETLRDHPGEDDRPCAQGALTPEQRAEHKQLRKQRAELRKRIMELEP